MELHACCTRYVISFYQIESIPQFLELWPISMHFDGTLILLYFIEMLPRTVSRNIRNILNQYSSSMKVNVNIGKSIEHFTPHLCQTQISIYNGRKKFKIVLPHQQLFLKIILYWLNYCRMFHHAVTSVSSFFVIRLFVRWEGTGWSPVKYYKITF